MCSHCCTGSRAAARVQAPLIIHSHFLSSWPAANRPPACQWTTSWGRNLFKLGISKNMVPPFDIWAGTFDIGVVSFVLACYWDVILGVFNPQTPQTISEPHWKSISCFIWKIVRRLIKSMPAPSVTNISYDLNKFYEHTFYCLWRECLVNIICSQLLDIPAHVHTYIVYVPSSSTVLISTCDSIQSLTRTVSSPWSCLT